MQGDSSPVTRRLPTLVLTLLSLGVAMPLLAGEGSWVAIRVTSRAVFAGQAVRVTCSVNPHPDNRWLRIGVAGVWDSERQLDGDQARKTYTLFVEHVPCVTDAAYCIVQRANREAQTAQVSLTVVGCEVE